MLLLLLFNTTFAPHVLNWYSPLHVFVNVGVTFQIELLQAKLEGEVLFPKCLFIDDFFQKIIDAIFWVILIEGFFFWCTRVIWVLYIYFYTLNFICTFALCSF